MQISRFPHAVSGDGFDWRNLLPPTGPLPLMAACRLESMYPTGAIVRKPRMTQHLESQGAVHIDELRALMAWVNWFGSLDVWRTDDLFEPEENAGRIEGGASARHRAMSDDEPNISPTEG